MADCALQESSKLISRKIWVMQKSWSFHTVCLQICSIWNTSKAVLYHWDNAFLTLCCKSQNVFDFWTTQIYGFYCTSSSYQLHCPPCNIMPPGVVNWNLRKESRHSRNFFVEVITVILQTVSFEINKQSINPTYLNLGHAKALVRTLSANRLNDRNNHIC